MRRWRLDYAPHLGFPSIEAPWLNCHAGSIDPVDQIAAAASLGFVAVCDKDLVVRDPVDQARIGEALRLHNMKLGSIVCGSVSPFQSWGSADPRDEAVLREELRIAIAAAGHARAQFIIASAQQLPDRTAEQQRASFIDHLDRWAADEVLSAGLKLCIEPISPTRLKGALVTRVPQALEIIVQVGRKRVGLVFDTAHIAAEGDDLVDTFASAEDDIAVVQLADLPGRVEPGAGTLDLLSFLQALNAARYKGLVELEHVHSEPGLAGELLSLARLRMLDDELDPDWR